MRHYPTFSFKNISFYFESYFPAFISAIIASASSHWFSFRSITIAGGAITSISLLVTALFADSINHVAVAFAFTGKTKSCLQSSEEMSQHLLCNNTPSLSTNNMSLSKKTFLSLRKE